MATSGTATFTVTAAEIIAAALRKIGVLRAGGAATSDQSTAGMQALNLMAQAWRSKGLKTWARTSQTITLTAAKASYTIGPGGDVDIPRPLRVLGAYLRYDGTDVPVRVIAKQEYDALADKDAAGTTNQVFYDSQFPLGVLYPWPIVASTGYTLTLDLLKRIEDFNATTDTPDFPVDWYEALVYGLAMRIAPEYGKPVSKDITAMALQALAVAESSDFEAVSVYFVPDMGY